MVLNLCIFFDDALYLYQVSSKYLTGFQSFGADTTSKLKFSKNNNSIKCSGNFGSCSLQIALWCYIFLPSYVKISQRISKLLSRHDFYDDIFQGARFRKNVGGVMILVL